MARKVILFRRLTGEWAVCSPEGFCILPPLAANPAFESKDAAAAAAARLNFNVIAERIGHL